MKNLRIALKILTGMCVTTVFIFGNTYAADEWAISMYDETAYTQEVENSMNKMHELYLRASDQSLSKKDMAKAKKEYYKIAQGLVRSMHERIMKRNIKLGAAMSHTEIMLSNHMTMMLLDMLAADKLAE